MIPQRARRHYRIHPSPVAIPSWAAGHGLGNARGAPPRHDRSYQLRRDQEAAPKLRATFPTVEQLRIELSFEGGGTCTPVPQSHILIRHRAYFSFRCPYSDCDGRFNLDAAVHAAVAELCIGSKASLNVLAPGRAISARSRRANCAFTSSLRRCAHRRIERVGRERRALALVQPDLEAGAVQVD